MNKITVNFEDLWVFYFIADQLRFQLINENISYI
jgi:hypothetical protein